MIFPHIVQLIQEHAISLIPPLLIVMIYYFVMYKQDQ